RPEARERTAVAAPAQPERHRPFRPCIRAPVRAAPRLLRDRLEVRASILRHRVGSGRSRDPALHARLLPPRVRPLHRDHDAEPEAGYEEEPEGATAAGALPGDPLQDLLPARLPLAGLEVRTRGRLRLSGWQRVPAFVHWRT